MTEVLCISLVLEMRTGHALRATCCARHPVRKAFVLEMRTGHAARSRLLLRSHPVRKAFIYFRAG
jgi:hypothetical protein